MSPKNEFYHGIKQTLPLIFGAIPFGLIYGALAVSSGFSLPAIMAMSLFVFAGSSQFIAVGLFAEQTPVLLMIVITFVVNLRHMLYSLSLLPFLKHFSQRWRALLAFWLTDETYAVTIYHFQNTDHGNGGHWFQLGSSIAMYLNWQLWSFFGMILGERIPDAGSWGFDVAMPITFIGMLFPFVKSSAMVCCVLTAGAVALITFGMPYKLGIILSAACGIATGILVSKFKVEKGRN